MTLTTRETIIYHVALFSASMNEKQAGEGLELLRKLLKTTPEEMEKTMLDCKEMVDNFLPTLDKVEKHLRDGGSI